MLFKMVLSCESNCLLAFFFTFISLSMVCNLLFMSCKVSIICSSGDTLSNDPNEKADIYLSHAEPKKVEL